MKALNTRLYLNAPNLTKEEFVRHIVKIEAGRGNAVDLVRADEIFLILQQISYKAGRTGGSWVNNHAHVLRASRAADPRFLNYSLAYYPFTPRTTGFTGRRKLTQRGLMTAPFLLPPLVEQRRIVEEVERRLSVIEELEATAVANLKRAERLLQSILHRAFTGELC
jgi:type I restriction enzyme S subunit